MYQVLPVSAIVRFTGTSTAMLLRSSMNEGKPVQVPKRSKVKMLTRKSLLNLAFFGQVTAQMWKSMITLTYLNPPVNGKEAKKHLREFLQRLRRRMPNVKIEHLWFMEFQKKGNVHFHILLNIPRPLLASQIVSSLWARITKQGEGKYSSLRDRKVRFVYESIMRQNSRSRTWENIRDKEGAARYIAKYAAKPYQKHCPIYWSEIGRFWGLSSGARRLLEVHSITPISEGMLRYVLRKNNDERADWEYFPRIMWGLGEIVSRETILSDREILTGGY